MFIPVPRLNGSVGRSLSRFVYDGESLQNGSTSLKFRVSFYPVTKAYSLVEPLYVRPVRRPY